jgi:hypothetical protein
LPLLARRIVPSTPPGNFFRRFRTALGPGGHPGDKSRRLSTVLRCAQYRMVAGPMGHGSRLCFRSGLAGVARARCRVECGALRSFINGKLLHMSDFAGGGIMAGSRPVAILARGRSSEAMAAGATEQTRHRRLAIDKNAVERALARLLSKLKTYCQTARAAPLLGPKRRGHNHCQLK